MRATADFQRFFKRNGAPVTMGLICGVVGIASLFFLIHVNLSPFIVSEGWLSKPWVLITYPFAEALGQTLGVVELVFLGYWLFWVGSELERELGSLRFGLFWLASTVVGGLVVALGAMLLRVPEAGVAAGASLPISCITVAWGVRNKNSQIRLMMTLPITGIWLAWLTVAIILVRYGYPILPLGIIACIPLGISWAYATGKLPGIPFGKPAQPAYQPSKAQRAKDAAFFDDVRKREQERTDRERLRKLFEGSVKDDLD